MVSYNVWNADVYDEKLSFVSDLGKDLIELLNPKKGEKILDLGCGTGDLAYEISKSGATVIGMDLSSEMIGKARTKYKNIQFVIDNGESFRTNEEYDAVFSNAALHWMKQAAKAVESIALALRVGGRFVAEFGGKGNVETVVQAIADVLFQNYGIDATERNPWYFPSIGEYSSLLEKHGFRVLYASHFDRPTPLPDQDKGLNYWLDSFAGDFFTGMDSSEKVLLYEDLKDRLRPYLCKEGTWIADYKRIRVMAIKER
ncbi:class I SAM-dependent methyltransferase [Thermaerobacillus caldiproteolyticus]|uniref:class I SAM-dependent methyltransferase n=1 Tax=Thermaerobacillus caldiproteolyticus TaxID=247480 RepID=UPI0018F140A9|nr:class I SAM-dependent methyltransferase [Anoxybacillus caldiproteolyticus]